jgi:hypothetical protein
MWTCQHLVHDREFPTSIPPGTGTSYRYDKQPWAKRVLHLITRVSRLEVSRHTCASYQLPIWYQVLLLVSRYPKYYNCSNALVPSKFIQPSNPERMRVIQTHARVVGTYWYRIYVRLNCTSLPVYPDWRYPDTLVHHTSYRYAYVPGTRYPGAVVSRFQYEHSVSGYLQFPVIMKNLENMMWTCRVENISTVISTLVL